ncbi:M23 family metallopeptidase [Ruania albidiflava]|uniref:M23 family metallopeptidase n=1 Tax=Ruania albidiflava TaxID=366586 RepID=UPI0003B5EE71|nr:peptidoglycan DD-metalloendopeptidase family protein [Ruania albidiflava]
MEPALPPSAGRRAARVVLALAVLTGLTGPAVGAAAGSLGATAGLGPIERQVWLSPPADAPAATGYDWPVAGDPPQVVQVFDPPPKPWLPGHRGVDLAAVAGARVRAAGPGTVVFAGQVAGRPVVSIQHDGGLRTTYEPVTAQVQAGDAVETGTVLGQLVDTGAHCATACLHWGLRTGTDRYLDPLLLVGQEVRIRLYPPG